MQHELSVASDLAQRAGDLILSYFGKSLRIDSKAQDEPVTIADKESSALIVAGLNQFFPDDLVISEESEPDLGRLRHGGRVWFVDPLDGTKEFIRGLENFSVLIGLAVDGKPTLGVVFRPIGRVLYRASPQHPAERITSEGTTQLKVTDQSRLSLARLTVSESDRRPVLDDIKRQLQISDEVPMGSVGLKFCMIAAGLSELYINPTAGAKAWDTCASLAILHSAGGRASDVFGNALDYLGPELWHTRGIVASNGLLHSGAVAATASVFDTKTRLD
jgi:3'(2'), 5'-bisphosphate nucleotidase